MTAHSPDLSHGHMAERRQADILAAVRKAFIEKGFDGASMQDLARAAGMSVGNFYRYFPSKAAIVAAIIEMDVAEVEQDFAAILTLPDPIAGLRLAARKHVIESNCSGEGLLWAEISAAALRKGDVAEVVCRMESAVHDSLLRVIATAKGIDQERARHHYAAHADLLMLLVKGAGTRIDCALAGRPATGKGDLGALVLRTIDQILDEIAAPLAKV